MRTSILNRLEKLESVAPPDAPLEIDSIDDLTAEQCLLYLRGALTLRVRRPPPCPLALSDAEVFALIEVDPRAYDAFLAGRLTREEAERIIGRALEWPATAEAR